MVLANSLYNTWPKDGTAVGIIRGSTLYEELFHDSVAKFHGPSFSWIGNLNSTEDTCLFSAKSQVTTPADLYLKEHIIGASAVGALAYSLPKAYDDFLGTKFNIVLGYEGVPDRLLALQRGEIDGMCGIVTATVKSSLLQQLKGGTIRLVVQAGLTKDPDFESIPNMLDQADNKDARIALEFLFAQLKINIALAAPPGIPPDRADALRDAFSKMIKDPDLRAETKTDSIDFHPLTGKETSDVINQLFSTPPAIVDRVSAAVNGAQR
jgi:tripartite-type tricarboxylate transporter receptor subunit TctC